MNEMEQIIRINGYIQRKLGTLTYGGKPILCVALDHSCTFEDGEEIMLDTNQLAEIFRQTYYVEAAHTILILKLDREEATAKRLAEEELVEIFAPYTDKASKIEHHVLSERFQDRGMIGYLIRITARLNDEEVEDIRDKQREHERRLLANIGTVTIDNVAVGTINKEMLP